MRRGIGLNILARPRRSVLDTEHSIQEVTLGITAYGQEGSRGGILKQQGATGGEPPHHANSA
jgi:hypothetical protein